MGADDDLCVAGVRIQCPACQPGVVWMLTFWLLPGSFTVVNCSSLYLWNAGPRLETTWGVARVLMSASSSVRFARAGCQWREQRPYRRGRHPAATRQRRSSIRGGVFGNRCATYLPWGRALHEGGDGVEMFHGRLLKAVTITLLVVNRPKAPEAGGRHTKLGDAGQHPSRGAVGSR